MCARCRAETRVFELAPEYAVSCGSCRFGRTFGVDGKIRALPVAAVLAIVSGLIAAWFALSALAFAALVIAALAIEAVDAFGLLGRSIFSAETTRSRPSFILALAWDAAFAAVGILSIDGSRAHRLFTPLLTAGLFHVPPPTPERGWRALAGDRGLFAVLLALAAGVGLTEGGFMLLSLLLVALRIAVPAGERG